MKGKKKNNQNMNKFRTRNNAAVSLSRLKRRAVCVCVLGDTGVDRLAGAQEQFGWAGHHRGGLPSSGRFPKSIFCVNRNLGKFSSFSHNCCSWIKTTWSSWLFSHLHSQSDLKTKERDHE